MASGKTIRIATRGSALALAQSLSVKTQCESLFPHWRFELKIIKTTGDKLQTAAMAQEGQSLPKGLFTKELEVALLSREADFAVHSLKDLPTELPAGLRLGATTRRADARDVLFYRARQAGGRQQGFEAGLSLADLPAGAVVATSSTRRKAQLRVINPALQTPDIRGNVATRMRKLAEHSEMDATILALAGITRLQISVTPEGGVLGEGLPQGLLARILTFEEMLPCVGQGAVGIEVREDDAEINELCVRVNDLNTMRCVRAERAFLAAMGGGCQSPVAAYAQVVDGRLQMQALSFASGPARRANDKGNPDEPEQLGRELAVRLK